MKRGEKVVLVRLETSPEDIDGYEGFSGHPDRPRRYDQLTLPLLPAAWVPAVYPAAPRSLWMRQIRQFALAGKDVP